MSNIEKYKGGELLPALANDPKEIIEALRENLGGASISESNLTKIKVPSGAQTVFAIPSLEGEIYEKQLIGTVVFHASGRAYFATAYDDPNKEDLAPNCASDDGLIGIGHPGGSCAACPMAKFGSASSIKGPNAKGQACSERMKLYMLRGDQMIPDIVSVPPTSIKACRDFLFLLAKSGVRYYQALISITLKKAENASGVAYGELEFNFIRALKPEESPNALAWNGMMKAVAADGAESRKRLLSAPKE